MIGIIKKRTVLFLCLLALTVLSAKITVYAETEQTSYVDANGHSQASVNATVLTEDTLRLSEGWYVVPAGGITLPKRISISGTVNLILRDGAKLSATNGILVAGNNTFVIWQQSEGTGELVATGAKFHAAIGGNGYTNADNTVGTIIINGGKITATGGYMASGIGSGSGYGHQQRTSGGTITINGGIVTAKGGSYGAGIGGGSDADSGTITINGGVVKSAGNNGGAGIGGGDSAHGQIIRINGGTITATGGGGAAGIGGGRGNNYKSGTIEINGGTITSTGASGADGIGKGSKGIRETLTIASGLVTRTGTNAGNALACPDYASHRGQYVEVWTHTHSGITYTVNENTLTGHCSANECNFTNGDFSLSVKAESAVYDGNSHGAALSTSGLAHGSNDFSDFNIITGTSVSNDTIEYYMADTRITAVPRNVGNYTAKQKVTINGTDYAISKDYQITQRAITIKANDQTVDLDGSVSSTPSDVKITDGALADGQSITSVSLAGDTSAAADNGTVAFNAVIIKDSDSVDVTENYMLTLLNGKLTVIGIAPTYTAPEAKTLEYDGQEHELVTDGSTADGIIYYTLMDSAEAVPDDDSSWQTSVPTGKDAGTYYVWWKLTGDSRHQNVAPAKLETIINPGEAVAAAVTAYDRTYDATEKPLVNVTGSATGGKMQYATGADSTTVPTEGWGISIPTAVNAGKYYVWSKAAGDKNHLDSEPACITASIQKAEFTPFVRINNWTVGEEPATPVLEDNIGNGEPTYTYAVKGTEEFIASVPVDAGQYILKARIEETDNYKSAEAVCSFVILEADHQHAFGSDPSWLWRFIDGKAYAEATYSCICGETETVATDVVKSAENDSRVTYTATGRNGIPDTHTFNKTFTVTYNNKGTEYEYGATCRLTAETASDWTVTAGSSSVVRAEGTKTFYFTVTENVTVEAKESKAAQQSAKIDVSSYGGGTKQFTYKVFWSLPEGAQVKSTMIYRSKDNGFALNTAAKLLEATSLRSYDMKLNVRNGEFKYTAVNLTSGTKQTVMARVVYSLNGKTCIIDTDPVSIAIE